MFNVFKRAALLLTYKTIICCFIFINTVEVKAEIRKIPHKPSKAYLDTRDPIVPKIRILALESSSFYSERINEALIYCEGNSLVFKLFAPQSLASERSVTSFSISLLDRTRIEKPADKPVTIFEDDFFYEVARGFSDLEIDETETVIGVLRIDHSLLLKIIDYGFSAKITTNHQEIGPLTEEISARSPFKFYPSNALEQFQEACGLL